MKKLLLFALCTASLGAMDSEQGNTHKSMPAKDQKYDGWPTLNGQGYCFKPLDPISMQFACAIDWHRRKHPTTKVLEIGVGYGKLAKRILRNSYERNECSYRGVDLSEDHLKIATQKVQKVCKDQSSRWETAVEAFPLEEVVYQPVKGTYDYIGSIRSVHFYKPERFKQFLSAVEYLLRPGGQAHIYTVHADTEVFGLTATGESVAKKYYQEQKERGVEFPGYMENLPAFVEQLTAQGIFPKERAENSTFKQTLSQNFLFLTTEDFCEQVKKQTKLIIKHSMTIDTHQNGKLKKHVGMVLEKPAE